MTIALDSNKVIYTGNGVTTVFPFSFRVDDVTHLQVYLQTIATGVLALLTNTVDYTTAGIPGAGSITYNPSGVPLPATQKLILLRVVPVLQGLDINNQGGFYPEAIEEQLDLIVMAQQQLEETVSRAVVSPLSGVGYALPLALADAVIGWNILGTALEAKTLASIGAVVVLDDATLAAASHTAIPSQYSVKAYVDAKIRSVKDYGALGNGVQEDGVKFQAAIDALPASGGTIKIPGGTWLLNVRPNIGTKSVQWDIDAGATFTGTVGGTNVDGTSWPRANTNYTLVPFGIFSQVQTSSPLLAQAPASGLFEALQPAAYNGNSVAVYAGASGSSATGNVWAINALIKANVGAGGTYQAIEVDVDSFSAGALLKGIGISGVGTQTADVALEIQHGVGFDRGIDILNSTIGMQIRTTCATALSIYVPGATGVGGVLNARQLANSNEIIALHRKTDAAPTGNFLRFRNAADNADLYSVDINGDTRGGAFFPGLGNFVAATAQIYTSAVLGHVFTAGSGSTYDGGIFSNGGTEIAVVPHNSASLSICPTAVGGVGIAAAATSAAHLTMGAGTAAKAAIELTAGVSKTTTVAGDIEYDGKALYFSHAAASRGAVAVRQIATVQGSPVALSNSSTSAQNIFAAANDVLTVAASTTYRFRARLTFNTGATSHTTAFGFGGTATFTTCNYTAINTTSALSTIANPQMVRVTSAPSAVIVNATTAATTDIILEGILRTNAAGTIIPQVTFSAGPTGTCETAIDSYFELEPIGSNTVAAVGNWA